jgi:AraC-like DNA-binding protein
MHEVHSSLPRPELRAYVRAFAQRKLVRGCPEVVQPVPAGLEHTMEFEFGDYPIVELDDGSHAETYEVVLVGPSVYRRANIRLGAALESFAVFFQPLGFWKLFRIPVREFLNRHFDCSTVVGAEVKRLRDRMAEAVSFRQRVELIEVFLLGRIASSLDNTAIMHSALRLSESRGTARVSDVATCTSLGVRQFERRFFQDVGLSPKLYARVARFQTVLDAKVISHNAPWLNLAHKFGYHDQMHMIRDFQSFSGLTPRCLLQLLGDMRPHALASSQFDRD